jgi:thiol-disulfide isomerase/thioredoxin
MITAHPVSQDVHRNVAGILLILLVLGVCPLSGRAGELSAVAAASPPELNLPDLSAQPRSLDEFTGKVLLVSFWASWCTPCVAEIPGIRRLARDMRNKPFAVVGVNVGEAQRRVQATAKRLGIDFTVLLDTDGLVFRRWGATVLPTSYILDRSGRVRYVAQGPLEWDRVDIVELLGKLAEQRPRPD